MDTTLINLSKILYELKQKNISMEANNVELEKRIIENEENLVFTMLSCVELYETLVMITNEFNYGKDAVEEMSSAMVKIYANLIKRGLKTIDDVPMKIKTEVEKELNK